MASVIDDQHHYLTTDNQLQPRPDITTEHNDGYDSINLLINEQPSQTMATTFGNEEINNIDDPSQKQFVSIQAHKHDIDP